MRVLQVMAGAVHGGAETAFEDIVIALHDAGLSQHVITRPDNKERIALLRDAGLSVDTLPFGGWPDIYTPWRIKQIAATFRPDIIQTWMSRAAQKTPRVKGVVNVARLGGYYNIKYFRTMDYFVANTPDIARYLRDEKIAADRIVHINNFAKIDDTTPAAHKVDVDGTPADARVALVLARYHPVKGLDTLLRAAADMEGLHIWLAGQGNEEASLRQLAMSLGMADRAHFLGWRTDRDALMRAADICVIPSRSEPFGNVMVQAWGAKTPLISSMSEGPRQYIRDGADALLFPVDDVDALRAALRRVMGDATLRQSMTAAGYARYKGEFTQEVAVDAYRNFYASLIKRRDDAQGLNV